MVGGLVRLAEGPVSTEVHGHHPGQDFGVGGLANPLLPELAAGATGPELLYSLPRLWRKSMAKKCLQTMNSFLKMVTLIPMLLFI